MIDAQRTVFTVAVSVTWRVFVVRDRIFGQIGSALPADGIRNVITRHSIASGGHALDAVFVQPASQPVQAALLVCHGIGEIVEHWVAAQDLLADYGVASLVFDYTGYGRSRGVVDWSRCEQNAIDAFEFLRKLAPGAPVSILGFSLGSGIAAAILDRIRVERLFLCSAFTSFRDAACVLGLPRRLAGVLPAIWDSAASLKKSPVRVPVLVLHCERDRAFPVHMAEELAARCGRDAEFAVVPDHAHNEAFYLPKIAYWRHVVGRLVGEPAIPSVGAG